MELNDVKLFGRVVRDAVLKTNDNGLEIARFVIATNRARKNEQGKYENVGHFFPIVIFGNYAEKMQPWLTKGKKVIISGFLRQNRWDQDGEKRSAISIGVNDIQIIFDSKTAAAADTSESPDDEQFISDLEISEPEGIYIEDEEQY